MAAINLSREHKVDEQLVREVLRGNKASFDALVLKYQYKIAKLISRYIQNPAEIMDVTQEVFIKVYRSLDKFRGESAFYTWLYRIAVNTAKNYLQQASQRQAEIDVTFQDAEELTNNKLKEFASPEHLLLRDEIQDTVLKTLDELPEELRLAIILREIEGFSYEEIADVLQCPLGTVRSRLFRAREAIDQKLKPLLDNE